MDIGHMPQVGALALTGIGLCFPVVYLIGAFTMLVAISRPVCHPCFCSIPNFFWLGILSTTGRSILHL